MFERLKSWYLALSKLRQIAYPGILLISIPLVFILCLRICVSLEIIDELPSKFEIQNINSPLASELYASNDQLIGKYFIQNRSYLKEDELNSFFVNALIATEDRRFHKHNGVDKRSLFRVFFKTLLLQRESSGGGSTITQQLAKNLYPRKRYKFCSTLINKFREMSIAKRIEKVYSKNEILFMYANTVSFGEQAFGLATASKRFFNKEPKELLIEEAATLVGLLKATTFYSPRKHPERSLKRRNLVLDNMVKNGFLQESVVGEIKEIPLILNYNAPSNEDEFARYFKQYVKKEFLEWKQKNRKEDGSMYDLRYDGLKIYTSLDFDLQVAAEKIMKTHMEKLQEIFLSSWKGGKMYGKTSKIIDDQILAHPEYKALRKSGLNGKKALAHFTKHDERRLWTWNGYAELSKTKIDSIKHYLSLLHTGILAVSPQDGKIKVWVGGNDYGQFQYDNITSPRQVGSLFKPIVYLTALEQGKEPCDFYKNEKRTYTSYQDWTPGNSNEEYGGYMSMKNGLAQSVNTVSVQILFDAGIDKVIKTARLLGIKEELNPVPSLVLGTSDVSLFSMVKTYASIANKGVKRDLSAISKIEDKEGNLLYEFNPANPDYEVIDFEYQHFDEIDQMMHDVTHKGTASRLYQIFEIPYDVRGKTGTTQNQSDGWFIGYTKDLVIGAWVGTEDRRIHFRNLGTGSGGRTALPMVGAIFEYAANKNHLKHRNIERIDFECPDTLTEEQYAYFQKTKETEIRKDDYGGWLSDLFKPQKSRRKRMQERMIREQIKKIKRQKEERLRQYEKEQREWEKKLRELNEESNEQ